MNARLIYSFAIISSLLISHLAFAAPQGGVVAAGTANISQAGNITTINQSTPSAVINWHSFDTAGNETVNFNQPDKNSVVLNRINSGLPTNFAGSLNANGKVFIVNPAGMVFLKGSNINAASFIATTADIKDDDFMQGKYKFAMPGDWRQLREVSIINNGNITASEEGLVALVAPNVINTEQGIITASEGNVILATGMAFVLDFNQDGLINFDASSLIFNGHIENAGKISAYDGKVLLATHTVTNIVNNVVNTSGIKEANNLVVRKNGDVILTDQVKHYTLGSITNTGSISSKYITLNADTWVSLGGSIESDGWFWGSINASALEGNIWVTGSLKAPDITLSAKLDTISISDKAFIKTSMLKLYARRYVPMTASQRNNIGDLYYNDQPDEITQLSYLTFALVTGSMVGT